MLRSLRNVAIWLLPSTSSFPIHWTNRRDKSFTIVYQQSEWFHCFEPNHWFHQQQMQFDLVSPYTFWTIRHGAIHPSSNVNTHPQLCPRVIVSFIELQLFIELDIATLLVIFDLFLKQNKFDNLALSVHACDANSNWQQNVCPYQ